MELLIQRAETGEDKRKTYKAMMSRHKLAMKNGFFLEALLIDYALIEDRLMAFLWAAGVVQDRNAKRPRAGNKRNGAAIRQLFYSDDEDEKSQSPIQIRNISCKVKIVQSLISFAEKFYDGNDRYLEAIHKGIQDLDLVRLATVLNDFEEWRNYRNEVIHGAMNKNIYSLYENIEEKAKEGLEYARIIDNESQKLKRRKFIRKAANMPIRK